jgi:hypothetical protein
VSACDLSLLIEVHTVLKQIERASGITGAFALMIARPLIIGVGCFISKHFPAVVTL